MNCDTQRPPAPVFVVFATIDYSMRGKEPDTGEELDFLSPAHS